MTALPQPDNNELAEQIIADMLDSHGDPDTFGRGDAKILTSLAMQRFIPALAAARKEGARIALTAAADDGLLDEGPEVIAHIMALPEYGICDESFEQYLTGPHDEASPPTEKSE